MQMMRMQMPLAAGVPEVLDRLAKSVGKVELLPLRLISLQVVFKLEFEEFVGTFGFSHDFVSPMLVFLELEIEIETESTSIVRGNQPPVF